MRWRGCGNSGEARLSNPVAVLDTTFLICLADKNRSSHAAACAYYQHFREKNVEMLLPTVVIAEFCVKQSISTLPIRNFRVLPFNLPDALLCAALNVAGYRTGSGQTGQRDAVKDDFKIIAQAQIEQATFLVTDDAETLSAYCTRLRADNKVTFTVVLLSAGFDMALVNGTGQTELPM